MLLSHGSLFCQGVEIKNGVNIQASYYNNGQVNMAWDLMKTYPEIEAVRIEIEPYRAYQATHWIKEAHENGYQVIATYHDSDFLGTDSLEELMRAANWWKTNFINLSSSGPIIINVMNEWGSHSIDPEDYASAYNEAIAEIRTVYDGRLIIDVPGFGQATKIAADAYPLIEDEDITFSAHIYTTAYNIDQNRWLTAEDMTYLEDSGAKCMVGEFCNPSQGGADWCTIIDHCYQNGWPLFGWAWNGDGQKMNMIEPHWRDEPLAESYKPTEFLTVITNKLKGVPCFSIPDEDCEDHNIGDICNDGNEYTINDRYNEYCHCIGTFQPKLQPNTTEVELFIYPNPVRASQELSIEFFKINEIGDVKIFNSLGDIVMSESVNINQTRITIDTHKLVPGIYWASFQCERELHRAKAFVVN